jgi:glycosyltransferase involved in cell wall biosynthesis
MKITLAHPGVGPFVQQTARALLEAGLLVSYWTTFADQPEASWRRTLVRVATAVGIDMNRELERRAVKEVPASLLRTSPYWELARTLLARIGVDPRLVDAVWERETLRFDRCVARRGLQDADGIYGYEFSALASFREAQRRGLARVYEVSSPAHGFVQSLIQREIEQFPELDDGKRKYFLARQSWRTERQQQEWALADVVIANSTFTRDSYAAAGLDVSKVRIVPLGAPPINEARLERGNDESGPLRVLWVGTFSIRKGAHYLLSAWRRIAPSSGAILNVFGANELPRSLTSDIPASVFLSATVPKSILVEHYRAADVLVFPTLCDGFGLVITEAFAHGLPVVTTRRAGAADFVRHGENGLIIPAGDASAIAEALQWCLSHRVKLKAMRQAALETAKRMQWSDFRQALARQVIDGLRDAGYAA